MVEINIAKYQGYFHDGSIIDIKQSGSDIEISMDSAEIMEDLGIPLSKYNRIKGILFIHGVTSIECRGTQLVGDLTMAYDSGEIVNFLLEKNKVELAISWSNYNPNPEINEFTTLVIEAKSISWETIPDLLNPNW